MSHKVPHPKWNWLNLTVILKRELVGTNTLGICMWSRMWSRMWSARHATLLKPRKDPFAVDVSDGQCSPTQPAAQRADRSAPGGQSAALRETDGQHPAFQRSDAPQGVLRPDSFAHFEVIRYRCMSFFLALRNREEWPSPFRKNDGKDRGMQICLRAKTCLYFDTFWYLVLLRITY